MAKAGQMPGFHSIDWSKAEMAAESLRQSGRDEEVTDRVLTVPNVISFIRLCMAPIAFVLLVTGKELAATAVFAISACTDFVDGQIARRTHTVSRVGQLLDPAVDRLLMICAIIGLLAIGRLPVWIFALILIRDGVMLIGGTYLMKKYSIRVPVIYAGKFATTFLFVGMAGLMLNVPQVQGLGLCSWGWLPGFNTMSCSWGIWFIYIGLCLGVVTTIYYVVHAYDEYRKVALGPTHGESR